MREARLTVLLFDALRNHSRMAHVKTLQRGDGADDATASTVSAGKLHVLGLAPLKNKLGPKWERLSGLVHKLFETAIERAQGSSDRFMLLDELSYAIVFDNLSLPEAERLCGAIAREVCQALFGEQIDEVSVRSIVAAIAAPPETETANAGKLIEAALERHGRETVYTQSVQSGSSEPVATVLGKKLQPPRSSKEQIRFAHALLGETGARLGFFPVWELQRNLSSSLFAAPFLGATDHPATIGRASLDGMDDEKIVAVEIAALNAAVAYASRIADCQKICAVGAAVSYKTLSVFRSRIRYITALQTVRLQPSTPLILRIEQIPVGTPAARIGDLAAMMKLPNMRITLEFQSLQTIPEFDFSLNAAGLGGAIPKRINRDALVRLLNKLAHTANLQKAFAFVDQLESHDLVETARQCNIRFGMGTALGMRTFSGVEDIPNFPLALADRGRPDSLSRAHGMTDRQERLQTGADRP